jgi:hypothetical protein
MKKKIVVVLCVIIAGIGAGILWKTRQAGPSVENILPEHALFYARVNDVEKNLETMAASSFWKSFADIDYDLLARKGVIKPDQKVFIDLVRGQLSDALQHPAARKLFGREVALAVYPPAKDVTASIGEIQSLDPKVVEGLLSGIVLVTRIDSDVQFVEFISRFFSDYGPDISQGQFEYKGELLRTVTVNSLGIKFGAVCLKGLVVIGVGEQAARLSVDVFKGDKPALARDAYFVQAHKTFGGPVDMTGFLNFKTFLSLIRPWMEKSLGGAAAYAEVEQFFTQMSGFKSFGFSVQLKPLVKLDSRFFFEPKELNAQYAPLYTCPAGENKTVGFIPKEVLGYQWSNCLKLDYYWDRMRQESVKKGVSASRVDAFESRLGLDVERDILPAFGDEMGWYVSDIQLGGMFPIPKLLLFIKVGDRSKTEKLLAKLKEQPFMALQDETYKGVSFQYLPLPLGEDIQPGYGFLGDYLLIATGRQLIKSSVDASADPALSLSADPAFQEVNAGWTDKSRSVQFFKVDEVMEKMKGVVEWAVRQGEAQDKKRLAFKAGGTKPLEEVKADIVLKEGELKGLREQAAVLEEGIWNKEAKGEDVGSDRAKLNSFKIQLDAKQAEIAAAKERRQGLAKIVDEYGADKQDEELRKLYMDNLLYPAMEGLKSISACGLRITATDNALESSMILKVK